MKECEVLLKKVRDILVDMKASKQRDLLEELETYLRKETKRI